MKRSTLVFQGILILLLLGGVALGLRGRMSAIADSVPSASVPPVIPSASPTPIKAPVKPIPEAIAKLPSTIADTIRQDLSQKTGIPADKLQLVQSTPKTWSDGCLGLAKADEMCSQAMVPGWQVVFSNGTQRWVYRTNATGKVYRMEPTT
ncbi:hypothetical protein AB3R30_18655 [Leptolyngbyaceae cyanobacterium UHCC 1019]